MDSLTGLITQGIDFLRGNKQELTIKSILLQCLVFVLTNLAFSFHSCSYRDRSAADILSLVCRTPSGSLRARIGNERAKKQKNTIDGISRIGFNSRKRNVVRITVKTSGSNTAIAQREGV